MGADVILLNIVLYSSLVFQFGCGAKNPPHHQYFNVVRNAENNPIICLSCKTFYKNNKIKY